MKVLVLNCGSSSIKYKLYNMDDESVLAQGGVERIGLDNAFIKVKLPNGEKKQIMADLPTHKEGVSLVFKCLLDTEIGSIIDANHEIARKILTEKRDGLDRLAKTLMIWETLDEKQVQEVLKGNDIGMPMKVAPIRKNETEDFKVELQSKVEETALPTAGQTPETV